MNKPEDVFQILSSLEDLWPDKSEHHNAGDTSTEKE
jgi:hypothetical protein